MTWAQTEGWCLLADDYYDNKPGCKERVDAVLEPFGGFAAFRAEWEWLKSWLSLDNEIVSSSPGVAFSRDVCFTHQDLQPLNILKNPDWGDNVIKLIDFEVRAREKRKEGRKEGMEERKKGKRGEETEFEAAFSFSSFHLHYIFPFLFLTPLFLFPSPFLSFPLLSSPLLSSPLPSSLSHLCSPQTASLLSLLRVFK